MQRLSALEAAPFLRAASRPTKKGQHPHRVVSPVMV
jgi:hypothetical protein